MATNRWLTGVALIGAAASIMAAGLLWLVATKPGSVAATLGLWLDGGR